MAVSKAGRTLRVPDARSCALYIRTRMFPVRLRERASGRVMRREPQEGSLAGMALPRGAQMMTLVPERVRGFPGRWTIQQARLLESGKLSVLVRVVRVKTRLRLQKSV
jgi:hypothetical protein